jgi:hypothetical protein
MKKVIILTCSALALVGMFFFASYWFNTQPVWVTDTKLERDALNDLPVKNKKIIELIEASGALIAPSYEAAVCTEFVIHVIDSLDTLTKKEKNDIRIITNEELNNLIAIESPLIKGVQTALVGSNKGIEVDKMENVKPGDFVQFWNVYQGKAYGHCGVVLNINPNRTLTLYSSHPFTNGYGKQKFWWPDKMYFVRLQ